MGLRGPPPKPNVVKMFEGNPGRRPINLADGINPVVDVPNAPEWLNEPARAEWDRIGTELESLGLISYLDRTALTLYCQSWGQLCQLEDAFLSQQQAAVEKGREAGIELSVAALRPFFAQTPSGFMRQAPLFRQILEMRDECHRYLASFGLSPAARMRVKAASTQGDLFDQDALGSFLKSGGRAA